MNTKLYVSKVRLETQLERAKCVRMSRDQVKWTFKGERYTLSVDHDSRYKIHLSAARITVSATSRGILTLEFNTINNHSHIMVYGRQFDQFVADLTAIHGWSRKEV